MSPRTLVASVALLFGTQATAAELTISKASATSTYPPEAGAMYSPSMIKDGKLGSSWVEGSPGAGLGQSIMLELPGPSEVATMQIWAGMWYSAEFWGRANRPREVEIKAGDGTKVLCQMADKMEPQTCRFDKPLTTDKVTITFKGTYSGTTWMDMGLSEVRLYDSGGPTWHATSLATASSELADDGDGPYTAVQVSDGMVDSMWCEGSKDGDGTGEWVQVDFGGSKSVAEVAIVNGIGSSMTIAKKSNRATKATLTFSDGSTKAITLEDSTKVQTFPIAKSTSSIKLTVDGVLKGTEYNDLCISELRAK